MIARHAAGNVPISKINENWTAFAQKIGFNILNPKNDYVAKTIHETTGGKGADVVFEVLGSQPGVDLMTAVAATHGRMVMVAIHAAKPQIDMFQFFWRELDLIGARVYRPEDYDKSIALLAKGAVDCDAFTTDIQGLSDIQSAFETLTQNPNAMKSMIRVREAM